VVREIRIAPSFTRREQNVHAPPCGAEPQPRSQGKLRRLLNQRPLELPDEPMRVVPHDEQDGLPASHVVIRNPPAKQRHDHRGAQPHQREVNAVGDRANGIGHHGWRTSTCDNGRLALFAFSNRLDAHALSRLFDDARAPAGTDAIVLRLGNEPRRSVHDLEPRPILVPAVAGDAPGQLRSGFTASNRLADGLRGDRRRDDRQRKDEW
jgi:hypothetical protein